MLVSELIEELEEFKERVGDLPVYYTKSYMADVEIDTVKFTRGHQCLLGNHYIDNYTLTIEQQSENLAKDMLKYSEKYLDCTKCKSYYTEEPYCALFKKGWEKTNVFTCFTPKSHIKYKEIYQMQHYLKLLHRKYNEQFDNNNKELLE